MPIAAITTVDEARRLEAWANRQPARWAPVTVDKLAEQLGYMDAVLPSKLSDSDKGRRRAAVYASVFGDCSEHAIRYMVNRAIRELKWFPTPSECLAIIADHQDPETPRQRAFAMLQGFAQTRFEDFRAKLKAGEGTPDLVASAPDQWKRICVEQGFLRWTREGGFVIEERYLPPSAGSPKGQDGAAGLIREADDIAVPQSGMAQRRPA